MGGQLQQHVGANVRALRRARKESQEAFAERLGLDRSYLGKIERGERNLSLLLVEQLAERLEVPALLLLSAPKRGDSR